MNLVYDRAHGAHLFDPTDRDQHPERDDDATLARLRDGLAAHVERVTPERATFCGHLLRSLAAIDAEIDRREAGR